MKMRKFSYQIEQPCQGGRKDLRWSKAYKSLFAVEPTNNDKTKEVVRTMRERLSGGRSQSQS